MKSNLIAYALDFSSFLIQKALSREDIKNIILFGSVARGEATISSDIDIFIDVVRENEKLEKEIITCLDDFQTSSKYKTYWKMLDVKNEIKLTIGEFGKWKQLQPSLMSNGILLYGKFMPEFKNGRHMAFFIWENIKPNSKRVLFNKQLFGYNQNNKFYKGLIQKYNGQRLGKGCISVPLEFSKVIHNLFKSHKITVKIKKIVEYT